MIIFRPIVLLVLALNCVFSGLAFASAYVFCDASELAEELAEAPFCEIKNVLVSGGDTGAFATPSVIVTKKGTIIITSDLRVGNAHDYGNIHEAICIRSTDDGKTWSDPVKLAAVPDRVYFPLGGYIREETNEVVVIIGGDTPLKTKNGRLITEKLLLENPDALDGLEINAPFAMVSKDDGLTWQRSNEITSFGYGGCWAACITLEYGDKKGRMIMPSKVWIDKVKERNETPACFNYSFNCVSYSDDGGKSWQKGGLSQPCSGECCVVELSDGRLYMSNRNHSSIRKIRSYAISMDGGESFAEFGFDEELIEPICHASMIRCTAPDKGNVILFANPASDKSRHRMTVKASLDDCKTWPIQRLIDSGKSGYSAMGVTPKGTVILAYERGEKTYRADLAVARFNLSWLFSEK